MSTRSDPITPVKKAGSPSARKTTQDTTTGQDRVRQPGRAARYDTIIRQLENSGILEHRTKSVSAKIDQGLVDAAVIATGAGSIREALEIALAYVVIDNSFHETFARLRGSIPQDVDLNL